MYEGSRVSGSSKAKEFFTQPWARLHQSVTGEALRIWLNPEPMTFLSTHFCSLSSPPDWQGHPPMHQPFLPAWGIFCSFLSFSSEGLLSSCWLDFGSLAAAPSSPLSAVGLCTSMWSCPSLNCQMPRAVCPPRSLPPDMQNWEAREQTLPAETEAKKALSASVLWHEVVLTASSEPLSSRCPACSSILAYCHVTSKCFGPSGMWKYSFSVWAIHDVAFNLFIFYCKVAFIWKIVLIRYAWLMLITVVIF